MSKCLLENLKRLLVYIRSDIYDIRNYEIVNSIIQIIENGLTNDELVQSVLCILEDIKNQLIMCDNEKNYVIDGQPKEFMLDVLHICLRELENKNYAMAYDIVDMLHVFPEVIGCNDRKMKIKYWKVFVCPVIKKWKLKRNEFSVFYK